MTRAPMHNRTAPEPRERARAIRRDAARLPECFAALFARWAEGARAYGEGFAGALGHGAARLTLPLPSLTPAAHAAGEGAPCAAVRGNACCKLNKAPPAGPARFGLPGTTPNHSKEVTTCLISP